MKMKSILKRSGIFTALIAAYTALAMAAPPADTDSKSGSSSDAQYILSKLHHVNQMEIDAGQLGQQMAVNDAVRRYGEQLVHDHQAADEKVKDAAKQENVQLVEPTLRTDQEREDMQRSMDGMAKLKTLNGPAFDRDYLDAMEDDHRRVIQYLTKAGKDLPNSSPTKSLINDLLPQLKKHQQTAANLAQANRKIQ